MDEELDNIIKYLDNEMSENERLDFENRIRKEEVLAKEVAFQRDLHGFLEREKPELEQKLSKLGDEFIINQPLNKRVFPYYWTTLLFLIIVLFISYFVFFNNKSLTPIDNQNPPKIEGTIPTDKIEIESQDTIKEPIELEPTNEVESPLKNPLQKPEKTTPIKEPIALLDKKAYERNAIMEGVIVETYRTNEPEDLTIVTVPKEDAIFKHSEKILFIINGSSTIDNDYQVIIYSNRDFDIENDYRVLDSQFDSKLINGQYQFDFKANLSLEKGLYYLVLRKKGTRDILHISRFTVEL